VRDAQWRWPDIGEATPRMGVRSCFDHSDTQLGKFLATRFGTLLLTSGDFVMAHRQMQGIKRRAEWDWRERAEQAVPA
jgi:hypothetical protein